MKMFLAVFFALSLLLTMAAAQTTDETMAQTTDEIVAEETSKDWLIMVHMTADNDLESYGIDDINEMERGVKTAIDEEANKREKELKAKGTNVTPEMKEKIRQEATSDVTSRATVLVMVDRADAKSAGSYDDTSNGNWTGTRYYEITPDRSETTKDTRSIDSKMVKDLGEVNMGDPESLANFTSWAMENYPAENTATIIWNHGSGWKWEESESTKGEPTKSIGYDYASGYDALTPEEMEAVFSSMPKQDIIGYDACLMQMTEQAYEYKDYASIIIGSEQLEPGAGWTYAPIIAAAFKGSSPEDLAKTTVNSYKGSTLSAIDTAKMNGVVTALDGLLGSLSSAKKDKEVLNAYKNTMRMWDRSLQGDKEYGDLYSFANNILKANLSEETNTKARNLMKAADDAIIAKHGEGNYKNAGGMTIWMPLERNQQDFTHYSNLSISETRWDESVDHIVEQNQALQTTGQTVGYDSWW
jgi:hypothetical protein